MAESADKIGERVAILETDMTNVKQDVKDITAHMDVKEGRRFRIQLSLMGIVIAGILGIIAKMIYQ